MKQKTQLVIAAMIGIFTALFTMGVSYVIFPKDERVFGNNFGVSDMYTNILWAVFGLGLAAAIAIVATGVFLIIKLRKQS